MANVHAVLAIIGSVLAALTATILIGGAILVPAAFAIGAGIYVLLKKKDNQMVMIGGAVSVVAGVLAALGAMGGFGGGGFAASFGALTPLAAAFAILGCLELPAGALKEQWDRMPKGGSIAVAVLLAAAVLLAFIFSNQLANQGGWQAYVVAVGSLVGIYPAIAAVRTE